MSRRRLAAAALLAAAAALPAGGGHGRLRQIPGEQGEVVEAEGWAPMDAADPLGTKRRSLADAEKKAVEEVVGVYVSAKTRVDAAVNVDQRILANVDGYIRRYALLGERAEDGFLKTRIEALVLYKKVGEDLKQLGLTRPPPPPGNPRVAVLVRVLGAADDAPGVQAAQGLRAALLKRGFLVVDPDERAYAGPKSTEAASAAGADLVVRGEAEVQATEDPRLGGFHSERARFSVEAFKPKTGEVLANCSREASAVDPSQSAAAGKALSIAADMVGAALAQELSSLLKSRIALVVRVEGLKGLDEVQKIVQDLRLDPGVAAAALSDFRDGRAEIQVATDEVAGEELARMLTRGRGLGLSMLSVSAYEVRLKAQ